MMDTAEMLLRRNAAGCTLRDQIRDTVIRSELNIFNSNNQLQNNKLNWIHRAERMEPKQILKHLMDYTPTGIRSIGHMKLR
jgi:hypothetical protein